MPHILQPLTPAFPMDDRNLVEASAGTGKTYSIQSLFLRLVLEQGFDVRKVLVVTFTEAATKELRDRLRQILQKAARFADGDLPPDDEDYDRIAAVMNLPLPGIPDDNQPAVRQRRLRRALLDFDNAAIWTIHGFCSRVLKQFAFECRHEFDAELEASSTAISHECCEDWWRRNVYAPTPDTLEWLEETDLSLKKLKDMVDTRLAKPDARLAGGAELQQAIEDIADACRERKEQERVLDYSDLLLNVRDALTGADGASAQRLVDALTEQFQAGLIDEFQDTDPVQYEIFSRLFLQTGLPTFLVGDPKQAIYGFRNGDIFTYYAATRAIDDSRHYSLTRNYRSAGKLVDAVNAVFKSSPGGWQAFKRSEIHYDGTLDAQGKTPDQALCVSGRPDPAPFKLWVYEDECKKAPGLTSSEARCVYAETASEIVRLLHDDTITIAGRPVVPGDIAVLVLTHNEAGLIANELRKREVPVVLQNTGNVFDTVEARDLAVLLQAMAEPTSLTAVRSALATDLFDLSHAELGQMLNGQRIRETADPDAEDPGLHSFEDYVEFFRTAHERWQRSSFIEAFNYVARRAGLRRSLAALENGERRLTNVLQLAELLHRNAVENRFGMDSLLNWLATQLEEDTRVKDETHELRLETDDAAVRIMTVFKSKGLQFPIVLVSTIWRRQPSFRNSSALEYHEDAATTAGNAGDTAMPLIVNLDTKDKDAKKSAATESVQEDIRLAYVAVTRAVHRAYLVTGGLNAPKGALKHLFPENDIAGLRSTLQARAGTADLPIDFIRKTYDSPQAVPYAPRDAADRIALTPPPALPTVDKTHGHTSFTGISPHGHSRLHRADDRYDFDQDDAPADNDEPPSDTDELDIFSFPAGAHTGECWHAIFEYLEFTAAPDTIRDTVDEQMRIFGLDRAETDAESEHKRRIVDDMVRHTLDAELPGAHGGFRLNQVNRDDRLAELEFNLPLRRIQQNTTAIAELLGRHWAGNEQRREFLNALEHWDRMIPSGFLTGFIDLVFRQDNRYFILDWKSNKLDGTPESFGPDRVRQEMATHAYFLQYLLYTVALHAHLQGTLPGYACDQHLGGVYYVFLRGTQPGAGRGIYHDLPTPDLIHDLTQLLIDTGEPSDHAS